jgi:UDP-N-acetylmuramoyl-L-alanine---L-glutamate ligase
LRIYDLEGQRVALWGAGREAAAAHRALSTFAQPRELTVISDAPASDAEHEQFAAGLPVRFLHGQEGLAALQSSDAVIRSPGISRYRPEARALAAAGVRLTTGTNLWLAEHLEDPVLMVTGTKGKSTTSALIAQLAPQAGASVVLAGNIGSPLLDHLAPGTPPDLWVVELSSYQAADLEHSPRAAVVLNLHPEHIDWHGSHARYYADKLNVLRDRGRVHAILNARDEQLHDLDAPTHTTWFGTPTGYDAAGATVTRGGATVLRAEDSPLAGEHNALNICAALSALDVMGMPVSEPASALADFQPLPHRLQTVRSEGSLRFIDDSISTTPQASIAALAALAGSRVALIAGGFDRDQQYEELADAVLATGVLAVVGLPDTGARLLEAIRRHPGARGAAVLQLLEVGDIEAAVDAAVTALGGDGVVLLSPAAPSYGAFRNFEERGERFAAAVDRRSANLPG